MRLIGKAAGIIGDGALLQPYYGEGIVAAAGDCLDEGGGPLGDETLVLAIDQDQPNGRSGGGEETIDLGGFELDQMGTRFGLNTTPQRTRRPSLGGGGRFVLTSEAS